MIDFPAIKVLNSAMRTLVRVEALIRPALVSLGVTGILLLGGCKTVTEKWLFENNNPPPAPDLEAPGETSGVKRSSAVVLPPGFTNVPITIYWTYASTEPTTFYAYTGHFINATTNLFGATENYYVTNTVKWLDGFERAWCRVLASNVYGSSLSYPAALPDLSANAVLLDSIPRVDDQVLLFESGDLRYWAGFYTRLPVTNMITDTTFYRVAPENGVPPAGVTFTTNGFPIKLTISELRLWNGEYYGQKVPE